jgi:hypothetical protein
VGGRGFGLEAGKTQSQKKAQKPRRVPQVRCTLCWQAFVQDSLTENQNHRHKTDKIIARTLFFRKN